MPAGQIASLMFRLINGWRHGVARAAALRMTIRGRILVAFLIMSVITAAFGAYATLGIRDAGVLVDKTFDESLMSINYARAAAADFAAMRAAFARQWIATDPEKRAALDQEIDKLSKSLSDDLQIAAERSQSVRATRAAENVQDAVDAWKGICNRLLDGARARGKLGDARPIRQEGRRSNRSPRELHRRRRLPVPRKRARNGCARRATQHRRHRARAVAFRAGGLGLGAAHRRTGRGCVPRRRTHRRGQARRCRP